MNRRSAVISLLGMFVAASRFSGQQTEAPPLPAEPKLTVEDIVGRARAGISEELIIAAIKKNGKAFDLNTDEILDLKKYGVSDLVIKYMLDPSQPYTPPAPKGVDPVKKYPPDSVASQVPADPGLYLAGSGAPVPINLKILLGSEEAKGFLKKKGKSIAYLLSTKAETRLKNPLAPFYLRMPDGKQMEEVLLVSFSSENGRRQLDVGASGPKQQYDPDDIHPFDSVEVGPHLYRINAGKLAGGEYAFLFIGSADTSKGIYGKGYDFGVDIPASPTKKPAKK